MGRVRLTGWLSDPDASSESELVVFVHGLGGSAERTYMLRAARAAHALGWASLRLNLRGADLSGDDIHHAGLIEDIDAAVASEALAGFRTIVLFGFSLGGHTCLKYAATDPDPRVRAVAALCSPVDLAASVNAFDAALVPIYRRYVLGALRRIHAATAARRRATVDPAATRRIRRIRDWDNLVVASRFGFESSEAYYRQMSAAPRLPRLRIPALYVGTERDPMVPKSSVEPFLTGIPKLERHWLPLGGHIGFPRAATFNSSDSSLPTPPTGIETEILTWLRNHDH